VVLFHKQFNIGRAFGSVWQEFLPVTLDNEESCSY